MTIQWVPSVWHIVTPPPPFEKSWLRPWFRWREALYRGTERHCIVSKNLRLSSIWSRVRDQRGNLSIRNLGANHYSLYISSTKEYSLSESKARALLENYPETCANFFGFRWLKFLLGTDFCDFLFEQQKSNKEIKSSVSRFSTNFSSQTEGSYWVDDM